MSLFEFFVRGNPRQRARSERDGGSAVVPVPAIPAADGPAPPPGSLPSVPGLDEAGRLALAGMTRVKRAQPGDQLLTEGEPLDSLCVILDGTAELTTGSDGEDAQVAVLGSGDAAGTLGAGGRPSAYTLVARTPCLWLALTPAALDRLPPPVQLALLRWTTGSALSRLETLWREHAAAQREASSLLEHVRSRERRAAAWVVSKPIQEIIASIPRLPPYATDLVGKLLDERTHGNEIVEVIKSDPALAALILKTVNSAYYGLPIKISDYDHALLHLGTAKVYQLVVATGIQSAIPATPEARDIQAHSKMISLIAYEIARASSLVRPEVAATIGLLHDLGRSVIPIIQRRHPDVAALVDRVDAAAVGAALLASWALPDLIVRPIEHQHEPEVCPPETVPAEYRNEVGILYLAHVCYDLAAGRSEHAVSRVHAGAYLSALRLRERTGAELWEARILPALARQANQIPAAVRESIRLPAWSAGS